MGLIMGKSVSRERLIQLERHKKIEKMPFIYMPTKNQKIFITTLLSSKQIPKISQLPNSEQVQQNRMVWNLAMPLTILNPIVSLLEITYAKLPKSS
jgi:hypothetical protein